MTRRRMLVCMVGSFALGGAAATLADKAMKADATMFAGKDAKEAGYALLAAAEQQAGSGSWEQIAVGRVYYLSGDKARGQAIFDRVTGKKFEASDTYRIGRVYEEAGEWDKAVGEFQKALAAQPKDDSGQAELGAWYNLHKDRAKAEELFTKAFARHADNFWSTVGAAGSYLGVRPLP